MSPQQVAYAQKRRSSRIEQAIPLVVQGVGALREPYQEQVSTLSISCHGCTYLSKTEVIQGETVFLDVKPSSGGSAASSSRARVKWTQKAGGKGYQIAVELEMSGNIWGVASPPADWFPPRIAEPVDPGVLGRELKVVPRKEQQPIAAPDPDNNRGNRLNNKTSPTAGSSPSTGNPLAQLMVGLGEQIQTMAAQAASAALVKEKTRLLEEFRVQLREEAVKATQSAIASSREEIIRHRQAVKELEEAQDAATKSRHAQWRRQVEQDMESARQHLLAQGKDVAQRVDSMADGAVERVRTKIDATRSEAADRFVARIREQVAPMLGVAKDSLQKLQGAENSFKKESQTIFAELENQLAISTNRGLDKAHEDLQKNTAAMIAKSTESLQKLFQSFENAARANMNSLLVSAGNQMTKHLQEKAAQVSKGFTDGLEGHTRNYLEAVGKSLADITRKVPTRSGQ